MFAHNGLQTVSSFLCLKFSCIKGRNLTLRQITTLSSRRIFCADTSDMCTNGGYQKNGGVPVLDNCSSSCCNTLFVYLIKGGLESK